MNPNLKPAQSSQTNLYADFLIHLEEQPTPETIKRLQQKIEELQEKVLEQAKQAHRKELELHRLHDEKKGRWVLKYLEVKVQLANFKTYHEEQSNMWKRDSNDLVRVIKILSQTIREKEGKIIELLKDLDRDVNWMMATSSQCMDPNASPKEICFSPPSDKSPVKNANTPPNNNGQEFRNFIQDAEHKNGIVFIPYFAYDKIKPLKHIINFFFLFN